MPLTRPALALLAFLAAPACFEERPFLHSAERCATYLQAQPILEARCVACHGPEAAGGYRLDGYAGVVARRPDATQRVVAGDPASDLLRAARGETAGHAAVGLSAPELATLESWVLACRVAASESPLHARGNLNPGDRDEFHGLVLRGTGYELAPCRRCHGEDLEGGRSGVACASCHPKGVLDCSTCHGDADSSAPPRDLSGHTLARFRGVGAHRTHLADGALHAAYACDVCHPVPRTAEAEGHYRDDGRPLPPPARVTLMRGTGQEASYDSAEGRCGGSYCHSPTVDAAATNRRPLWTGGREEAACGSCHGLPPAAPHPADARCQACHPRAFGPDGLVPALHANGLIEVGDDADSCSGCHGSAAGSAPPADVLGGADPREPTVGAHQAHLGASRYRGPIPCSECHLVPTGLKAAGHLDEPGSEVFPASSGVGALARANGARPSYDPISRRCSSVYCHGNGARLALDTGSNREPSWVGGASEAQCDSCHGMPPTDGKHDGYLATECAECHRQTIDPNGDLVLKTDQVTGVKTSTHVDGTVNVGPYP